MLPDNFFETLENIDGSYNVTARLRIEPTPELDGRTISCISFITEHDYQTTSDPSIAITVKRKFF